MWRLLILFLAVVLALVAGRVATAQKTAFTADGARVYLFSNGTWSTDPEGGGTGSGLLELTLREARQSVNKANRCTLIFGLGNGFEVVDVTTCQMGDGTKIDDCFNALAVLD